MAEKVRIQRAPRADIVLSTKEDFEALLSREREAWSWVVNPGWINANVAKQYNPNWIETAQQALASASDPLQGPVNLLTNRYADGKRLLSTDPEAGAVQVLAKSSPALASGVLAILSGWLNQNAFQNDTFSNPLAFQALSHAAAITTGVDSLTAAGAVELVERAQADLEATHQKFRAMIQTSVADAAEEKARIASEATDQEGARTRVFSEAEAARQSNFDALRKKLANTDEFYSKQMEVQGAVRYWGARSKAHSDNADTARKWLIAFATLASIALLCIYYYGASWYLPDRLSAGDSIPLAALFKAGAFGILMTTVVFWIGRVILRIYLSERHLATDAEERRTMVMTYLALIRRQKLADDDKKLIIPAIFRSGSDGIIKEENSPDTAFAALVASFLKR